MNEPNLFLVCGVAFGAVIVLLSLLAGCFVLITALFPAARGKNDATLIAAISQAVSTAFPGARVVHIEEEK